MKSPSKRKRIHVIANNLNRQGNRLYGNIYVPKYGCEFENFDLLYHPRLGPNPEEHIMEQQENVELTVTLHTVDVEDWFVQFLVVAIA